MFFRHMQVLPGYEVVSDVSQASANTSGIRSAKGGFDNNQFQGSAGIGRQRLEGFHTLMRMISALRRKATVRCDCYIRSLIGCT